MGQATGLHPHHRPHFVWPGNRGKTPSMPYPGFACLHTYSMSPQAGLGLGFRV